MPLTTVLPAHVPAEALWGLPMQCPVAYRESDGALFAFPVTIANEHIDRNAVSAVWFRDWTRFPWTTWIQAIDLRLLPENHSLSQYANPLAWVNAYWIPRLDAIIDAHFPEAGKPPLQPNIPGNLRADLIEYIRHLVAIDGLGRFTIQN